MRWLLALAPCCSAARSRWAVRRSRRRGGAGARRGRLPPGHRAAGGGKSAGGAGGARRRTEARADGPGALPAAGARLPRSGHAARAADFYRKYLAAGGAERAAARAELAALGADDDLDGRARQSRAGAAVADGLPPRRWRRARRRWSGCASRRAAAATDAGASWCGDIPSCTRPSPTSSAVCATSSSSIACSRVVDVVRGAGRGGAPSAREFLLARLYGGEPLRVAWRGHLSAFMRCARAALRSRAQRSGIRARPDAPIASWRGSRAPLRRDERARCAPRSRALEARWRRSTASWRRWPPALLADVRRRARSCRGRRTRCAASSGAGRLRSTRCPSAPVPAGIAVEVYRVDLVLVLQVTSCATRCRAAARAAAPRRVASTCGSELEPTGEELVRMRVRDTSPEPLRGRRDLARGERGLGPRHGGARALRRRARGRSRRRRRLGQKAVVVRLFRALADATRRRRR